VQARVICVWSLLYPMTNPDPATEEKADEVAGIVTVAVVPAATLIEPVILGIEGGAAVA
jgi:hypothetical protein